MDAAEDAVERAVMFLGLVHFRHQTPVLFLGHDALLNSGPLQLTAVARRPRQLIRTVVRGAGGTHLPALPVVPQPGRPQRLVVVEK